MSRLRSWIFVSLALVIFPLDGPMFGATRPTAAQRCAAAKIAAAAKKSRADLACRAKGALAGGPPDSACLLKAQQAFDGAFSRAERRGGCVAPGDAGNVAVAVDHGVVDLTADTTGQCTAGCVEGCSGSFETCRWNGQTCGCGGSLGSCAAECSLIGTSGFCANAGDVCDVGTCSCVAGSRSLACDAHKLEATGQELRAQLLCQAKATTSGGPVDPACITKAETTFGHAFDTAEKAGGCAVAGNALGVEDAIIPWVNGIAEASTFGCGHFLQEFSSYGITDPFTGMAVDGSGNIFLTDASNGGVVKLDANGNFLWGLISADWYGLDRIAADRDGNVLVAVADVDRIFRIDNNLNVTAWSTASVVDIATDSHGFLYVLAVGGNDSMGQSIGVVQKYGNSGTFLSEFGTDVLNAPGAIAVGVDDRVFVADSYGRRIVYFQYTAPGQTDPAFVLSFYTLEHSIRLAADGCGNVFFTTGDGSDFGNNGGIAKYTFDGRRIMAWSASVPGDTGFAFPWGIAVDGSGNVLTIDANNAAVKKFGCACTP